MCKLRLNIFKIGEADGILAQYKISEEEGWVDYTTDINNPTTPNITESTYDIRLALLNNEKQSPWKTFEVVPKTCNKVRYTNLGDTSDSYCYNVVGTGEVTILVDLTSVSTDLTVSAGVEDDLQLLVSAGERAIKNLLLTDGELFCLRVEGEDTQEWAAKDLSSGYTFKD